MWDPTKYLTYADQRGRPYFELLSRVHASAPRRVVDLGCGPGNLTIQLSERWPGAVIEAADNSPEMVAAAHERGLDATLVDVRDWTPSPDTDVVISNATLQWVPEHRDLLRRWAGELDPGTWIAVQVPGNFDAPSHVIVRDLAGSERWASKLGDLPFRRTGTVDDPEHYAALLSDAAATVDAWETTYIQQMTGENPVLEWITGTALTPVKGVLDEHDWEQFRHDLIPLLNDAYPRRPDGITYFPFRRVFFVAQVKGV